MPVPPPPPPPPPPPSLSTNSQPLLTTQKATGAHAKFLNEIHKGTRLKKTVTNDRSGPAVEGKVVGDESNSKSCAGRTAVVPSTVQQKTAAPNPVGAMNLGDLFKDGVPRKPSDLKNQKSLSANQIVASNTSIRNEGGQQKARGEGVAKKAPLAVAANNKKAVENNHSATGATASNSTRAAAIENLQKSISTTAAPPQPPLPLPSKFSKLKPTFDQQPSKLPLSQHNQFQTLRPSKTQSNSDETRTPLRRSGSTEDIQKRPSAPPPPPIMRRPGAPPPPPPPLARPAVQLVHAVKKVDQPMNDKRSAPPRVDAPPPLPPPRVSSYLESMEQRFHFVPLSELPPPPKFVGFRKDYNCVYSSK